MPAFANTVLAWIELALLAVAVLVGPWLFGAWEMWWFWPLAALIFGSGLVFGIRLLLHAQTAARETTSFPTADGPPPAAETALPRSLTILLCSGVPFLVYAAVRAVQAPVAMDAERSFLLFGLPFLIGLQVLVGFRPEQRRLLLNLVVADLLLLGLYGLINHGLTGSARVLWAEGYPQYVQEHRATGTYFCPDHFAGIMEFALCIGLGILLSPRTGRAWKLFAALLSVAAVWGVVLSKSRGGGLTVLVTLAAALALGFGQWPGRIRWRIRGAAVLAAVLGLAVVVGLSRGYTSRFLDYFKLDTLSGKPFAEQKAVLYHRLRSTSRGHMIAGALRAWQQAPVFGIGPGMHQHVWPHYSTSTDGDREEGIRPTYNYYQLHSFEVHSDWVQLLEEYGLVGLVLFLVPVTVGLHVLVRGLRRAVRRSPALTALPGGPHSVILTGLLVAVCMLFHSLGDFNLQMPATTWLLAVLVSIPLAESLATEDPVHAPRT
jgi:O-antigen ligase